MIFSPPELCHGCKRPIHGPEIEILVDALEGPPQDGWSTWAPKPGSRRAYHPACCDAAGDTSRSFYQDGRAHRAPEED